jgi:hypothetical protein
LTRYESQLSESEQSRPARRRGPGRARRGGGGEGVEAGAAIGAETVAERGGMFSEEEAWDVVAEIPND